MTNRPGDSKAPEKKKGIVDIAGVCAADPRWLKKEFGGNGEYLLDHA